MKIEIDSLSYDELVELNLKISVCMEDTFIDSNRKRNIMSSFDSFYSPIKCI